MCGRYIPNTEDEIMEIRQILSEISIRLSKAELEDLAAKGDIYPTQLAPVIMLNSGVPGVEKIKWGFTKWDNKGVIINGRSESVNSSPFFRPYAKANRCIIPAHGYYEWKTFPDQVKAKFEFSKEDKGSIFMAGLYRNTDNKKEFVILTKDANENIRIVHDRMPLMLPQHQVLNWLNGSLPIDELQKERTYNIIFKTAV
jgi:putative SOS response-associated peptidase YedK